MAISTSSSKSILGAWRQAGGVLILTAMSMVSFGCNAEPPESDGTEIMQVWLKEFPKEMASVPERLEVVAVKPGHAFRCGDLLTGGLPAGWSVLPQDTQDREDSRVRISVGSEKQVISLTYTQEQSPTKSPPEWLLDTIALHDVDPRAFLAKYESDLQLSEAFLGCRPDQMDRGKKEGWILLHLKRDFGLLPWRRAKLAKTTVFLGPFKKEGLGPFIVGYVFDDQGMLRARLGIKFTMPASDQDTLSMAGKLLYNLDFPDASTPAE